MLSGEKVLVTGPTGQIGLPLACSLAADNEVWGIARFGDPTGRAVLEAAGVITRVCDVAAGDFGDVPDDFTAVIHLAASQSPDLDYDAALTVNAEGTGLLLQHCRRAGAALVMSTHSVYRPHEDPWHVFTEDDALGDAHPTHAPTYSISKIGEEAVARTAARALGLRVIIARMNVAYGPSGNGGLPGIHLAAITAGNPVVTRWDPCPYLPIHQEDINDQVSGLLEAASVPATIVNWAGDEAVSAQEWCAWLGDLVGRKAEVVVQPVAGTLRGSIADVSRRRSITGPCRVGWREGMRRMVAAR